VFYELKKISNFSRNLTRGINVIFTLRHIKILHFEVQTIETSVISLS